MIRASRKFLNQNIMLATQLKYQGTMQYDIALKDLRPTRQASADTQWTSPPPSGPIAHLLESVTGIGKVVDTKIIIWQHKEAPVDLMNVPYPHL